jgi:phosphopantothenate-cysteine ligase/phosphopantothenoylcysteine decarboxylase/phosphopantothenate--cysteine ligase
MNILVTAGNTQTPIDQVRCLTNIFTGRTGGRVALAAHDRGHTVCLLTSHPEVIAELTQGQVPTGPTWQVRPYRTFDELHQLLAALVPGGGFDVIIHAAAVSDYALGGVYVPAPDTTFDPAQRRWAAGHGPPRLLDTAAGKVKSQHAELWLRLVPTPKLVDRIRSPWGFRGVLVKFKLEVQVRTEELLDIAERSRRQSAADLMVANTLEGMNAWAYIGPLQGGYQRVKREQLATRLLDAVDGLQRQHAND